MAQNVTIAGASYSDVPAINVPKTGGGTAVFADPSGTTATASDVASGKYFLNSSGTLTEGTGSSGTVVVTEEPDTGGGIVKNITVTGSMVSLQGKSGINPSGSSQTITADEGYDGLSFVQINAASGSGLVYETGTYTPTADTAQPTISFANSHSSKPFCVLISDTSGTTQATNNSEMYWSIFDWYTLFGSTMQVGSSTYYARRQGGYKGTGSSMNATGGYDTSDSTSYVTSSSFKPSNGTSYYWRSGRTYKWIAVWKPTT
jgi:hypothetical protein